MPVLLCLLTIAVVAPSAHASRTLLREAAFETDHCAHCPEALEGTQPPPEGEIEGACGLAISPSNLVYVSDYYHRVIDVFGFPTASIPGGYFSQLVLPGTNPVFGVNTLDSVCGLAFDSAGNLYGNEWHEGVVRLTGGEATIESGESTGLAIDPASDRLYVNDRTYVAEYALPYVSGSKPMAKIGLGSLGDAYGLAVADGRVYVADADDQTVKIFEPATSETSETTPAAVIADQFASLTDAALAIDPTNDHLLVVDNLQPGFEHPRSGVLEFGSSAAGYPFLGRLPGAPIHGGPSGVVVDASGRAIVTDGNGELSNAFLYSAYGGGAGSSVAPGSPFASAVAGAVNGTETGGANLADSLRPSRSASASEVSQSGGVRVSFQGNLTPRTLPRQGRRPVVASVGAKVVPLGGRTPPQLRRIAIAINRSGHFAPRSLPSCRLEQIQPATTSAALAACRPSLVGEGRFSARVLLPEQAPFPSSGKVYAFNGLWHGRPAILAHVYGTEPLPVSYTIPFELIPQRGTYGTLLRASLPEVTGDSGYITGLSLTFGRGPNARGYVSAGCPVPAGLGVAPFPFARVDFSFAGERRVGSTLIRTCKGGR
jgi:DNA-binding beta-propeller fold protein YncE